MAERKDVVASLSTLAQVLSVVVGVVISILSFNATRQQEAETQRAAQQKEDETRQKEAEARQLEAAKPFLQLRQNLYTETVKVIAILANPETHSEQELAPARKRFRELYVAELSMVEDRAVEEQMVALARAIDPDLIDKFSPAQNAALDLAHALRDTFVSSWGVAK